ncbi:MAG: hypothetical protein HY908_09705 [Myxococcales bacterium]|nr:hypothetical protein [Myxococcales bacterium]
MFQYAVQRLRRQSPELAALTIPDLVLAALTRAGREIEGTLGDLAGIAGWIDYVNHDGCDAAEVRRILDGLVKDGWLTVKGKRWKLRRPWP